MGKASRLERGYKMFDKVDGKAGEDVKNSLNEISPDLVKYIIHAYADIFTRKNLDIKYRELAIIAALALQL